MKHLASCHTDRREKIVTETRATRVNGRTEMLPSDPHEVAKILASRRPKSPAARAKARITADLKRRGFHG